MKKVLAIKLPSIVSVERQENDDEEEGEFNDLKKTMNRRMQDNYSTHDHSAES
jgi:hypothetical protein